MDGPDAVAPDGARTRPPPSDEEERRPPTVAEMLEAIPVGVPIADEVDVDSEDPSYNGARRQCVAERAAGGRCRSTLPPDSLLCNAHAGKLDASKGGHALAEKRRKAREASEDRVSLARLGTRAVVAQALQEEAVALKQGVQHLARRFGAGDMEAARTVIPWLNQGLGMPTSPVELVVPGSPEDVESMPTSQLAALVAEGRRKLHAVPDESDQADESVA